MSKVSQVTAIHGDVPGYRENPTPIAIICNSLPPYRVHVHERVVRELPQIELWTLCTHETTGDRWGFNPPESIRPISFGVGEPSTRQQQIQHWPGEWRKGRRIIQWIREHRIRAVVLLGYNDPARLRVLFWCHRNRIPCYVWGDSNIRGDVQAGLKAWLKKLILPRLLRRCTGTFPCGQRGIEFFAKYGVPRDRMYLFTLEPDYELITKLSMQVIEGAAQKFGLQAGRRRIIYSGRLVQPKRVDLLLQAFITIAPQRTDWDLLIAGDGPLRSELEALVPPELKPRITWTGFLANQEVVSSLYRLADVLVLPSDYEPWALVVNEAIAAGLALVVSDAVGAAPELVREDINGMTFPAGNAQLLQSCLLKVTAGETIDRLKAASPHILQHWRATADPVKALNQALADSGVIAP